jgi:hypothetical protein
MILGGITDEGLIRRLLIDHTLPFNRMIEYDAFGRQALYLDDFLKHSPDAKMLEDSYHKGTLDYTTSLFIGALRRLDKGAQENPAKIYLAGAAFLENTFQSIYEPQALEKISSSLPALTQDDYRYLPINLHDIPETLQSSPIDLYAKRLNDPIMIAVAENEGVKNMLNRFITPRLTRETSLMLDNLAAQIRNAALHYQQNRHLLAPITNAPKTHTQNPYRRPQRP